MDWVWVAWIAVIGLSFAAFEGYALATNKTTLSRFVWDLSKSWPPFPWVVGVLVGFLAAHFFWPGEGCNILGL